jgi:hypothetical protein
MTLQNLRGLLVGVSSRGHSMTGCATKQVAGFMFPGYVKPKDKAQLRPGEAEVVYVGRTEDVVKIRCRNP